MSYTIVGAGRVARAFASALGSERVVGALVRDRAAAARLRRAATIPTSTRPDRVVLGEAVLFAVPDGAIADAARALAGRDWEGRVALHFAGALGPEPLEALDGAERGVLHPLQALGEEGARWLARARCRIEGSPAAVRGARRLARAVGLRPLELPTTLDAAARVDYHAAASLVANDLQVLFETGCDLLVSLGLDRAEAADGLARLAEGALGQLLAEAGALTGPATRGDLETVRAHLRRIRRLDADVAAAHRRLAEAGARRSGVEWSR